jgi:CheY-like chemotaxis protein
MPIYSRYRLAVVDDDPTPRKVLAFLFKGQNYEVADAENGIQALKVLGENRPHVLISDIQMPQMDGYQLLRIVREWFPEMGVVAISGTFDLDKSHTDVIADACFSKGSYTVPELLKCVAGLAAGYPLRTPARQGKMFLVWMSQDCGPVLWIACRNCLQCFPFRHAAMQASADMYIVQCPLCFANSTVSADEFPSEAARMSSGAKGN